MLGRREEIAPRLRPILPLGHARKPYSARDSSTQSNLKCHPSTLSLSLINLRSVPSGAIVNMQEFAPWGSASPNHRLVLSLPLLPRESSTQLQQDAASL
jgi:hypothetical protein